MAKEILQKPEEITVGGRTYMAYPPSVATLIMASEAVSGLPKLELDKDNIVSSVLRAAKDCRKIGEIMAILILGAKRIREEEKNAGNALERAIRRFFVRRRQDIVEELAGRLLEDMAPHDLQTLAVQLITRMQTADFFGTITFLQEINMTRPTKVIETTASGRS